MINHITNYEGMRKDSPHPEKNKYLFRNHQLSGGVDYITNWTIFPGDQVFVDYGENWFPSRKLEEFSPRVATNRDVVHIDDIHSGVGKIPGCSTLLTRFEDNKLIATMDIAKGSFIEVARALLLPITSDLINGGPVTELLWWKTGEEESETTTKHEYMYAPKIETHINPYNPYSKYAIVMFGNGMLYTASENAEEANVEYDWWDVAFSGVVEETLAIETQEKDLYCNVNDEYNLSSTTTEIEDNSTTICKKYFRRTHRGIACSTRMMISFIAKKDIKVGEELVVDLFVDQTTGFRYPNLDFSNQCL
jgi:hypothetical protein